MNNGNRSSDEKLVGSSEIGRGKRIEVSTAPPPQLGWQPMVYIRLLARGFDSSEERVSAWIAVRFDAVQGVINLLESAIDQARKEGEARS